MTFLMGDLDLSYPLSEIGGQRRDECGVLMAGAHPLHDRTTIRPQHAPPVRHLDPGDLPGHHVDDFGGYDPQERVFSPPPDRANHIKTALFHHRDEPRDLLGRVLKIRVEGDHDIAADDREAGQDRRMLTVVPRQLHDPDIGRLRKTLEYLQ